LTDQADIERLSESAKLIDPVAVVRSLVSAATPAEAVDRIPTYLRERLAPGEASDVVRNIVRHASSLVRHDTLSPPAEAGFLSVTGLARGDVGAVSVRAEQLLAAFLDGESRVRDSIDDHDRRTAFYYAAALLKQRRALAAIEQARERVPSIDGVLTGADRERVTDYLVNRSALGGVVETLERHVSSWQRLIESLECGGESLTSDDLQQSFIARDAIEVALGLMTPKTRARIADQVEPLDQRFHAASVPSRIPLDPPVPWRPRSWWWFHRPPNCHLRTTPERFT
jgi:hypothetical protein